MRASHIRRRLAPTLLASIPLLAAASSSALAQQQNQSIWSFAAGVGLAAPLGGWRGDLEPGREYRLSVGRTRNGSPWTFELELANHPFDFAEPALTARNDGSVRGYIRSTSVGLGVRRLVAERPGLSSWLSAGLALHSVRTSTWEEGPLNSPTSLRDEFVPGLNVGLGVGFGRLRLQPVLDARLRYVLLGERPLLSVPITLGLRF
jgi:hypothetical protein